MLAVGKAVKGLRCQLSQAHKHSVIRLSYNVSVLYIQQSLLHSCHFLGSLKYFVLKEQTRLFYGESRNVCLS